MSEVYGHTWLQWKECMVDWAKHHGIEVPPAFNPAVDKCGTECHKFLLSIQHHAGIQLDNGKFGEHTYKLLSPLLPGPTKQELFLKEMHWGISNNPSIHYSQTRPMPLANWKAHKLPLTTDCSGSLTCCAYAAGIPDPNGLGYNGQGYTGTMLTHLRHISRSEIRPGDFCIFGAAPGDHVAGVMEADNDPLLFSHGYEGAPLSIRLSVEARYHVGQPITWLRVPFWS